MGKLKLSPTNVDLFFSFVLLALLLFYVSLNILSHGIGDGVVYFVISFVLFLFVVAVNCNFVLTKVDVFSSLSLLLFLGYVYLLSLFTLSNLSVGVALFFDSASGMLYAFIIGVMFSIAISILQLRYERSPFTITSILLVSYFVMVSVIVYVFHQKMTSGLREHIAIFSGDTEGYQRLANMTIIINFYFLATINVFYINSSWFVRSLSIFLYVIYAIAAAIFCQLSSSNSGLVLNVSFCLAAVSFFLYIVRIQKAIIYQRKIPRSFAIAYYKYGIRILVLLGLIVLILQFVSPVDGGGLRILDTSKNSSFYARYIILKSVFIDQFAISPIFGSLDSSYIDVGKYSGYVHSIVLSLLTHTGLVGLFIYSIYAFIFINKMGKNFMSFGIYQIIFLLLLLSGSIATFFSWMPLWVFMGFSVFYLNNGRFDCCSRINT